MQASGIRRAAGVPARIDQRHAGPGFGQPHRCDLTDDAAADDEDISRRH